MNTIKEQFTFDIANVTKLMLKWSNMAKKFDNNSRSIYKELRLIIDPHIDKLTIDDKENIHDAIGMNVYN